ncbi:MAG TPA: hemerythrin domain-containing protein [Ornithinibacter sp.]|nr:hemerythrin domain-containing protein [Ornithinibacter sp.]
MCGYCGCESIDVIGRFMSEHVAIINATGDLRRACAAGDPVTVHGSVVALDGLLGPHTEAEEVGLFAVLAEDPEFADHVRGLGDEHVGLGQLLGRVDRGEHGLFPVLERALRDHIDREENGLFPAAAIAFAGPEWGRVTALTPTAPSVRS